MQCSSQLYSAEVYISFQCSVVDTTVCGRDRPCPAVTNGGQREVVRTGLVLTCQPLWRVRRNSDHNVTSCHFLLEKGRPGFTKKSTFPKPESDSASYTGQY